MEVDEYPASWYRGNIAATILLFFALAVAVFFIIALLTSKKVRQDAFNLYVLLIILPDALLVGEFAFMTAICKVSKGDVNYKPRSTIEFQKIKSKI